MLNFCKKKHKDTRDELTKLLDDVEQHIIKEEAKAAASDAAKSFNDAARSFAEAIKKYAEFGKNKIMPRN